MKNEYLVVYEKGAANWSAFSPDILGCGSMGEELEDVRMNMREAIEAFLSDTQKAGEPLPAPVTTSVNFEEFDPEHEAKQYFVEWLQVSLPQKRTERRTTRAA